MNQLKGELTSEQRRLLLRIDTLKNEISVIELEKMYERGRVDTVALLKMLQVI